jgi:glycosyltransferase involved in cell wall biosynthesis
MDSSPRVSVIMNCRNCEEFLREAINSVYAQTCPDWEIIFYDNLSSDGSAEIAQGFDGRLRYLRGEEPLPLGAARNQALAVAKGEFIAFLDCDDLWLPEKMARQLALFDADSTADFVYGNHYVLKKDAGMWQRKLHLHGKQPEGEVFAAFLRHYPVNLQTVMLRRQALERIDQWFDPALNLSEEYDLFMRILYSSRARYLKEPLACYRVHEKMSSIQQIECYPDENAYILEKLKRLAPDFISRFQSEIRYLEGKIGYWRARAKMYQGDRRGARECLRPHVARGIVFSALYLLTYLPVRIWRRLSVI